MNSSLIEDQLRRMTPQQLRAAITPRTRLLILNSPSNPTGCVYTPDEVKALGDVCVEKDVLIMSDEIYEHLLYDGAVSAAVKQPPDALAYLP